MKKALAATMLDAAFLVPIALILMRLPTPPWIGMLLFLAIPKPSDFALSSRGPGRSSNRKLAPSPK